MEFRIVARGILVGALGGLVAFVFARIFAEPVIGRAIDYESGRESAEHAMEVAAGTSMAGMDHGAEIFSRSVQQNVGIGIGMILFGVAMGALYAVVYCVCVGRLGAVSPRTLALSIAGGMFLAVYLVPFLKYPANPPADGNPDTIKERTGLYLTMVALSVALAVLAVLLGRYLNPWVGAWRVTLLSAGGFIVAVGLVMAILPDFGDIPFNRDKYGPLATETPQPLRDSTGKLLYPGFPADDLYSFRLYAVAAQAILWSVIALTFAPLAQRLLAPAEPSVAVT